MTTGRGLLRGVLAAVALGWAAVGLLLGLLAVLPTPDLGLWPSLALWFLAVVVQEQSLLLAGFAVLGLALAALARRAGSRRVSLVAAGLGMVTVALALVPAVQGWRTASREGVALSLAEYFALPSFEGSPETVTYARPGGEELQLDVWRPPDQGDDAGQDPRPAVVAVHGGGGVLGGRGEETFWSQRLAEQGYVVFSVDYRLASVEDQRAGKTGGAEDATGDVKCAVGWVEENAGRYGVDPDRVALMGHSFGGLLALVAAYTTGDPRLPPSCDVPDTGVEAVAAFYPPTDLVRLEEMPSPWWKPYLMPQDPMAGTAGSAMDRYRRLTSPTSHVDPGDPPTFLIQGGQDQYVPPEQSELLVNRLAEAGVPHRLTRLPWARHGFDVAWGGWGQQIAGHQLEEFLADELADQD